MTHEQAPTGDRAQPRPNLVSVVIPAFNAAAFLDECLDSVLAQQSDLALEICVVDDGSTDDTADLVRNRPAIRLIRHTVSRGPSAARNAGIDATNGEFVAFLDADDLWPAGSLAARVGVLRRHPKAALAFGDCRQFDARSPHARTLFESGRWGAAAWGTSEIVPDAYLRLLHDNFITTGSVVAKRLALTQAGGFAEDLRLVEDLDLWLRIARQQLIAWCPEICLLRRRHEANLSREPEAMALAFLRVLDRQSVSEPAVTRAIKDARAGEQLHLAHLALGLGDAGAALLWARKSLAERPTAAAAWGLIRAAWTRWQSP